MAKKTETTKKATTAKKTAVKTNIPKATTTKSSTEKDEKIIIKAVDIPQEVLNTDINIPEKAVEELKYTNNFDQAIEESRQKINKELDGADAEDAKVKITEEMEKVSKMAAELENKIKETKIQYTNIWNGINYNL